MKTSRRYRLGKGLHIEFTLIASGSTPGLICEWDPDMPVNAPNKIMKRYADARDDFLCRAFGPLEQTGSQPLEDGSYAHFYSTPKVH